MKIKLKSGLELEANVEELRLIYIESVDRMVEFISKLETLNEQTVGFFDKKTKLTGDKD